MVLVALKRTTGSPFIALVTKIGRRVAVACVAANPFPLASAQFATAAPLVSPTIPSALSQVINLGGTGSGAVMLISAELPLSPDVF